MTHDPPRNNNKVYSIGRCPDANRGGTIRGEEPGPLNRSFLRLSWPQFEVAPPIRPPGSECKRQNKNECVCLRHVAPNVVRPIQELIGGASTIYVWQFCTRSSFYSPLPFGVGMIGLAETVDTDFWDEHDAAC